MSPRQTPANRFRPALLLRTAALACALAAALPAASAADAESAVPPAIQDVRRAMLDSNVNTLTFRSMDILFDHRVVGRGGNVWQLPARHAPLDFHYDHGGVSRPAGEFAARTYTNGLLVMKDGRIVHEYYGNNMRDSSRHIAWSMTKSITSLLVGLAVQEGRIKSIDDPIDRYVPELKKGGYAGVTIKQVLQMRSGVDYEERYDFENPGVAAKNHENSIVRNVSRFADAAVDIPRAHAPGSVFAYKTIDTAVLGWLLEKVLDTNVSAYLSERIWEPLGAEHDAFFVLDGAPGVGREFTGAGFNATLRDFARLGQMMLDNGKANGRQIVPESWVAASQAPAAEERGADGHIGGYGYQWWTLAGTPAYTALGLQGQFIYIDPSTRTVVVKLSHFPPGDESAGAETFSFLKAVSAWNPD